MQAFSEELNRLVEEKHIRMKDLIAFLDYDRSTFFKIKRGERLPASEKMVTDIAGFMHLTPSEGERLLETYRIDKVGPYRYYGYRDIEEFILDIQKTRPVAVSSASGIQMKNEAFFVVRGELNVEQAIGSILCQENVSEVIVCEHHVSERTVQLMDRALAMGKTVRHLFEIDGSAEGKFDADHGLYNMNCLRNISTALLSGRDYQALCYYESVEMSDTVGTYLSNVVIAGNYAMQYSSDRKYAIVFKEPDKAGTAPCDADTRKETAQAGTAPGDADTRKETAQAETAPADAAARKETAQAETAPADAAARKETAQAETAPADAAAAFREMTQDYLAQSRPFGRVLNGGDYYTTIRNVMREAGKSSVYMLSPGYCFSMLLGEGETVTQKHLAPWVPNREEQIAQWHYHWADLQQILDQNRDRIRFMSPRNALEHMERTGYINEIPEKIITPLSAAEMQDIKAAWEALTARYQYKEISPAFLPENSSVSIVSSPKKAVITAADNEQVTVHQLIIDEVSITWLIYNYLKDLYEGEIIE